MSLKSFSYHLSPLYHSGSLCAFSTFHKLILFFLPLSSFFQFSQLFSCDYLWVGIYQARQRHIHKQPNAFDYCYLQRRPELCISQFGNLFLYTEFCVFLYHSPFLFCLRTSSCIFRPCHSSVNPKCEACLGEANSHTGNLWLPWCIFIVEDTKAWISVVWCFVTILLCTSLCEMYTSFFLLNTQLFHSRLRGLPEETKQSKTKQTNKL